MSKNLVIVGKEYPNGTSYALQAQSLGFNVFLSVQEKTAITEDTESLKFFVWNRESQVSSHSLVINAENTFQSIDTAVILFDANDFLNMFDDKEISDYVRATDALVLSYVYLVNEFYNRFKLKKHGNIVFIYKGLPTLADVKKSSKSKTENQLDNLGIILSVVQSSFKTFAENFAAENSEDKGVQISLIDATNSIDEEIATYVFTKTIPEFESQSKKQRKSFEGFKSMGKSSIFSWK